MFCLPDSLGYSLGIFVMGEHTVEEINLLFERISDAIWIEFGLEIGMAFTKIMAGSKIRGKRDGIFLWNIQGIAELCDERAKIPLF